MTHLAKYIKRAVLEIARRESVQEAEAFEKLINYLAVHMMIGSDATSRLKNDTAAFLDNYINIDMLKEANYDFLGEYYFSNILQKNHLLEVVNYDTINLDKDSFPTGFFVSDIQSGYKAISLVDKVGKNIIMYAKSHDLMVYRICLINKHLFDLPLFTLYVEKDFKNSHLVDFSTGSINWTYANRWFPTKASLLKTIS